MTIPGPWCPIEVGAEVEVSLVGAGAVYGALVDVAHGPVDDQATLLVHEASRPTPTVIPWTAVASIRTPERRRF